VVLPAKNVVDLHGVLGQIAMVQHAAKALLGPAQLMPEEVLPVKQAISGGNMYAEAWRGRESPHIRRSQCGQ
jgi:hypothetical protein